MLTVLGGGMGGLVGGVIGGESGILSWLFSAGACSKFLVLCLEILKRLVDPVKRGNKKVGIFLK